MADNRGSQESSSELEATNRTEDTPKCTHPLGSCWVNIRQFKCNKLFLKMRTPYKT